jgi:hypothetical protein
MKIYFMMYLNGINVVLYMLMIYSKSLVKLYNVELLRKKYKAHSLEPINQGSKCQAVIKIEQTSLPVVDMKQPRDQNR